MTPPLFHPDPLTRVEVAIAELRAGRMIVLCDDEDRENEGDLVIAAELITPAAINFMAVHARGLVCLSLTGEQVQRLALPMMASNNQSVYGTAFTVSIEAREGVTTGISAADRARTVQVAIRPDAQPRDVVTPGHMFPLRAREGGVLERVGQTEGSVDLARLAGLVPAAVICEIINDDGTMARMPELLAFAERHGLAVATVADVIKYRMRNERIVRRDGEGTIDVPGVGTFATKLYRGVSGGHHVAIVLGQPGASALVRVQTAPPPWGILAPEQSRLAHQARDSLQAIRADGGGVLVLMHVDGGSPDAIRRQFALDVGAKAPDASPTRAEALRDLGTGCQILVDLGVTDLRLLTDSPRPVAGIDAYGLRIVARVPLSRAGTGAMG